MRAGGRGSWCSSLNNSALLPDNYMATEFALLKRAE
jgi:hypothetical protein